MDASYLTRILGRKQDEIARLKDEADRLEAAAQTAPAPRSWKAALEADGRVALIAELKRKAPSAGDLNTSLDPSGRARLYERAGARALSVLTDLDFAGELADLESARRAVSLPVLRKDFILDAVQVYEARAAGADAILLIVAALDDPTLRALLDISHDLGMGALVEVHDEDELDRALAADAPVVGINNRDLTTFETSLDVTRRLAPRVPADRILVAESGVESSAQVREMGELGIDAVLVGTSLMRSADPATLAAELSAQARRQRS